MMNTVNKNQEICPIVETIKVIVTIDPSSISTRDNDRDNHLKSPDFFDVEKYKEIKFESTSISKKGESEYIIKGNLTIRDVTKEITLNGDLEGIIKDPYGKTRAGITVSGEIVREERSWNKFQDIIKNPQDSNGKGIG